MRTCSPSLKRATIRVPTAPASSESPVTQLLNTVCLPQTLPPGNKISACVPRKANGFFAWIALCLRERSSGWVTRSDMGKITAGHGRSIMFEVANAYEQRMGTWSKLLAPLFVEFVGVQDEVLDVGCGTGSLTFTAAENQRITKIVGLDSSTGFIEYARSRNLDPRVTFEVGNAQSLPFPDDCFDRCLSSLVI